LNQSLVCSHQRFNRKGLEMRAILLVLALGLGTPVALAQVPPTPMTKPRIGIFATEEALTAKKAEEDKALADCERHWDAGTHMTRQVWAQTCRRVQERFRQLDVR
jgi:hypothetical protein